MKKNLLHFITGIFCLTLLNVPLLLSARPDSLTVQKLRRTLGEWKLNSSGRCGVLRNSNVQAWKFVFEREINPRIRSIQGNRGKGFTIVVLIPEGKVRKPREIFEVFDWYMPPTDLIQYSMFLGKGSGYDWFVKGDLGVLSGLKRELRLSGGDDMDLKMAMALNDIDFDLYTSRVAVEYFRGAGSSVIPLIRHAAADWTAKHKTPPVQHMIALKLTGSHEGIQILKEYASSSDLAAAHQAIRLLLLAPYMAEDDFYRKVLPVPEYTVKVIGIFRERKKMDQIIPRLKLLAQQPRSFDQYVAVLGALWEYEHRKNFKRIPVFDAVNDILMLSMRMGDSAERMQYVSLDEVKPGEKGKMDQKERTRIEPALEVLKGSPEKELVLAGALRLASFSAGGPVSKEYAARIRRVGMEILRSLPRALVTLKLRDLEKSITLPKDRILLRQIRREYGGR